MARMLYLRDIDVDVQLRCCACGHEGVLPRADLVRRFGPSYPILSLAPHFRCSRCNSRSVESRPAPRAPMMPDDDRSLRAGAPEASIDEPLAMLQGLLSSVRASRPAVPEAKAEKPEAEEPAPWRMEFPSWAPISMSELDALAEDDPEGPEPEELDLEAFEEPEDETEEPFADEGEPVIPRAFLDEAPDEDEDWKTPAFPGAALEAEQEEEEDEEAPPPVGSLADTLASLREILEAEDEDLGPPPLRRIAPPADARDAGPQSRLEAEPASLAFAPSHLDPGETPESFAGFGGSPARDEARDEDWDDEPDERDAPAPAFSPRALVRDDFEEEDERQEEGWDADDKAAPVEEELSTEEILGFAIRDPERRRDEPELMPWERDRPPPSPDDEPIDKTIEALRNMVERAAAEPGTPKPGVPMPGRETRSTAGRKSPAATEGKIPFAGFTADAGGAAEESTPKPANDTPANDAGAPRRAGERDSPPSPAAGDGGGAKAEDKDKGKSAAEPDVSFLDLMKDMAEPPPKPAGNSAFEKTIATLRSMLELDGKRRR